MVRRVLLIVLLVCIFPAVSNAATFFLGTRVMSYNGCILSPNKTNASGVPVDQVYGDGALTRSYTSPVTVTIKAYDGFVISNLQLNYVNYGAVPSPYTMTVSASTDIRPSFAAAPAVSITAKVASGVTPGGTVTPSSFTAYAGYTFTQAKSFTFQPSTDYYLSSLSGVPAGVMVTPSVPATANVPVTVTFPVGYVLTAPVTLEGAFTSAIPVANPGTNQTALRNSLVTLTASYSGGGGTVPTCSWRQVAGPSVNLSSNGNVATFTPTQTGTCLFRVTLTPGDTTADYQVIVTDSLAVAARNQCQNCHNGNNIGKPSLFTNWSSSRHEARGVMCYACHVGTNSGGHPGFLTFTSVDERTFVYRAPYGSGSFCLNGTCHNPGVTHKTVGMACAACHNSGEIHNPDASFTGSLNLCFNCHGGANTPHYYSSAAIPLNQCTACHNPSGHAPAPFTTVTKEHFNGYTSYANPGYAAAYVTARTACSDCHKGGDPASSADADIKQYRVDWAASGHGAVNSVIWKNSALANWKATGTAGGDAAASAGGNDCVRCHSSFGYQTYLASGSIAPVGNLADHSSEPLACSACHNADFTVRALPAVTNYYNYSSQATGKLLVSKSFPDVKESNICLPCHSGRAAGDTLKAIAARTAHKSYSSSFWQNLPYLDSHGFTAGGQLFGATGYQYPGQRYDSAVGHSSLAVAGGAGPCVGCHMQDKSHTYLASYGSVCNACHTYNNIGASLPAWQADFNSALAVLQSALTQKGFTPLLDQNGNPVYPYFNNLNWGGAASGAGNMGAAQNFMLLKQDPGAYAHNPTYVKRLIRDSVDWLLNGSVDRSRDLTPTLNGLPVTPEALSGATEFLAGAANGSAACVDCHAGVKDRDGKDIIELYNGSLHASVAGGPSCGNCHAPTSPIDHPAADMLTQASDISAKCAGCHKLHSWNSAGICMNCHNGHNPRSVAMGPPHFGNFTTAQYVTTNVGCEKCHEEVDDKDNVSFEIYSANKQWARSSKASKDSPSYVSYDFKTLGLPAPATPATSAGNDCVRCHTTTGYINYVGSGFSDIRAWGVPGLAPDGDRTREMVSCAACHNPTPFKSFDSEETDEWGDPLEYAYGRREVPQVTAYYNYSASGTGRILVGARFPDQGVSNNCMACHSGTRAGATLKRIAAKVGADGSFWNATPFIDSHGMAGAGVMYGQAGYTFAARNRSYAPPNGFAHPFIDDSYWGGQGPCVACHLYTDKPHLFSPISSASNGTITKVRAYDEVCSLCHDGGSQPLDLSNAANLDAKKQQFASSLKALAALLAKKGIYFNPGLAPYFFNVEDTALQGAPDSYYTRWNAPVNPDSPAVYNGSELMGAAFNLRLLWGDQGAYAHNSYYAKRLIYDSIDLVDDGVMNNSLFLAIQNLTLSDADKRRTLLYVGQRP